jgi:hypothetical protein
MGSVGHPIWSLTVSLQERFSHGEKLVVLRITLAGPFSTDHEE